jgi:hypothetical protein
VAALTRPAETSAQELAIVWVLQLANEPERASSVWIELTRPDGRAGGRVLLGRANGGQRPAIWMGAASVVDDGSIGEWRVTGLHVRDAAGDLLVAWSEEDLAALSAAVAITVTG